MIIVMLLIGTPYKIPKFLFGIQNIAFHFMPKSTFEKIGCPKKKFISLVKSTKNLDIANNLDRIQCKSLILCGTQDKQNMSSISSCIFTNPYFSYNGRPISVASRAICNTPRSFTSFTSISNV